jgi:arsenite methyltransferase
VEELKHILEKSGFIEIHIENKDNSDEIIKSWNFGEGVEKMVFSAYIKARKPGISQSRSKS